jgi:outer membrane protein OmpA-like peptidoglycan-associated protein
MVKHASAAGARRPSPSALSWLGVAVFFAAPSALAQVTVGGSASGTVGTTPVVAAGSSAAAAPATPAAPAPAAAPPPAPPAADVPTAVEEAPAPVDDPATIWAERDHQINEASTLTGGVGLLHMQHAQGNAPGQFNVSFTTEWFSANFLCTTSFPCANPNGGQPLTSDTMNHIGGSIQLSATILKWLEGYAGTSAVANSDNANRPSLLQVLGDTDLGFKAFGRVGKFFHVGGAMELWLINGTGAVGLSGSGTSAKFRGLATMDLRETDKHTPLRFSINTQYSLDNTAQTIASVEQARGAPISRIERFGLEINRVDHIDIGLGAEAFFAEEKVRPFIEYNIMVPVNRQDYACPVVNPSGDNCLANDKLAPSKLTLGSRFLPWKHGFSVTAAFDIGITGQNDFIEEMSPIPPWTLYVGVGWGIDVWDRPTMVETKIVEKAAPAAPLEGHIKGYVHEAGKPEVSVPNAIVQFVNHPELTSLASGPDGKFNTLGLPPGRYDLQVKAEGYTDGTCTATLAEDKGPVAPDAASVAASAELSGKPATPPPPPPPGPANGAPPKIADATINCPLESLPKVGRVVGHVRDAETKAAVANATLKMTDPGGHEFTQTTDTVGAFHFDGLAPGGYQLDASQDQYLNDTEHVDVKPRVDTEAEVVMVHRPKTALVQVTQKEIIIKQQVQFANDSAVILPASTGLLTEIADVLSRNPRIHEVEIQGHTDSNGDDNHNQILSEDRANAVRTWLVAHGVSGDRLTAKGYGEKKPLVPNVTDANRSRNRRVQFIIMSQDAAAPASK